jgi:hypothetical protein
VAWRNCVLRDGPFQGDEAEQDEPLDEHVRIWWCGPCNETHWASEAEEWPRRAARYTLLTSEEDPAVYVHDGTGVPDDRGEMPEQETPEHERELVPAGPLPWGPESALLYRGPATVFIDGVPIGTAVSIELEEET